ncbi:hypothetical protein BH11BAC5_BH11BAC5_18220 [soil metagenome]|jgi:hypothetical protein
MLSKIVLNYQRVVVNLDKLIKISGLSDEYLSQKISLTPTAFSYKKQKADWKPNEVLVLVRLIENKITEDKNDEVKMKGIKRVKFISSSEFEKRMNWM